VSEHFAFTPLATFGALANVAIGVVVWLVVRRLTGERPRVFTVLEVGAVTGAVAAVQVLMVLDSFAKLHIGYLWVFLTLPILGGLILASALKPELRPTRGAIVAAAGLFLLGPIGFYGTHVEPFWLRTERVTLDVAAVDGEPVRIGVLSDIQTEDVTDYEWRAVRRLMREEPDLILVAGDYFQSAEAPFLAELPELRDLLATLEAPGGVFLVEGDVDSPDRMARITDGQDLEWLDHEVATTEVGGTTFAIGGVPVSWDSTESRATIAELTAAEDVDVRILLSHRPDVVFRVPDGAVDLVVAGHTHGGQVRLPIVGPLITMSDVPRSVAAGGLHTVDGTPIYLSNGVGVERHNAPQVRLGDRPTVGVVTLT
jgi:predicted MPP superfamily phosphohydrolase